MSDSRWYFTEEQLQNSPSRECGVSADRELAYRQQAANLIQEVGQRLQVSQLCINTAIVYMHRFYAFHSFTLFHRNGIAAAAFFLAAKVEEQPRKLEHVIKILNICLEKTDNTRESYAEQAQELVFNENVLLQTLGFDVAIDHPHTHVVRACQLFNIVTVSRELRQTCYFMASNSLHLTTMCLKYRPTVVAAFCIYIACKWSRWEIPDSSEGKVWYSYVDENVTPEVLQKLTDEYLQILERSPSKFKSKMKAITSNGQAGNTNPSVTRDDGPSHKNPHDRHHHHHRSSSSSANNANRKPEAVKQPSQQAPPGYKPQIGQRPPSSSRPPYPPSDPNPKSNEDRTQHRQTIQEPSIYTSQPRPIDQHKQRSSTSQLPPASSSSSSQPSMPHAKPPGQESQRHSINPAKPPVDYHQKSVKQAPPPPSSQPHLSQQQISHKKPSWPQQPPQQQNPSKISSSSSQSHIQASHSQPNLGLSSATMSNSRSSSSQSLPSYNESTKQQQQQQQQPHQSQPSSQTMDFWFNDKLLEAPSKPISPLRQGKSMFSPSPEHEPAFDRTKMIMMGAGVSRDSPKSEKSDRRSSTPNKKEKRAEMPSTPQSSQKTSSMQQKANSVPALIPDAQRKRPFASVEDAPNEFNRENKARKLDAVKSEPNLSAPMAKQPIETNPDIVKSLLQECYTTSKFDSFGMDSPLDVINPEPQTLVPASDALIAVKAENGFDDEHHKKRTKSKKKKDKHSKKKKSHKSDREERKESSSSTSLKITLGKDKSDSKSSPESVHTGGLKIKIPIKDVNKTELPGGGQSTGSGSGLLKLKISKDKIASFSDSGSSSKKKDKDRSKSKHKHGSSASGSSNLNNNSEFKDAQHQQMSVNKMNSLDPSQQQQQNVQFGNTHQGGNSMQQQQFYQQQFNHQPPLMNPQHNFPFSDFFNVNHTQSSYNGNGNK